jgi:YVTN family beta-propeller protein
MKITLSACLTLFSGCALAQSTFSSSPSTLPAISPGTVAYASTSPQQTTTISVTNAGYLASVIPTPGVQNSNGGTSAVRNASDSSLTATKGSGEGLNQLRPATTAGPTKYSIQDDFPNLLPLPFNPIFPAAALNSYNPVCTPNTFYYVVSHETAQVTKIGTCPLTNLKEISVCGHPTSVQYTPDGATAIVPCYDNAIAFIDTSTDAVTMISTPLYTPSGVDVSPDGSTAYFTCFNNTPALIFSVSLLTRQINPQTVTLNAFPENIFLTPDGAQLWVTSYQSNVVSVIDTFSMTVAGNVAVPGTAGTGLGITPDGTRAYIAITGGSVSVIDTATLTQIATIPVADQPTGVIVGKEGSRVYVASGASNSPTFSVIDIASNTVIAKVPQIGPALGFTIFH